MESAHATFLLPYFRYRRSSPATTPGMFATVGPSGAVRPPAGVNSFGLSGVARLGVMSLYSMTTGSVMPLRNRIACPSPPSPEASGSTTPRAKAVAMPASTTLPPRARTSAPACDASSWPEATTPRAGPRAGLIGGCSAIISSITSSAAGEILHLRHARAILVAQRVPGRGGRSARVVHRLERPPHLVERGRPAHGVRGGNGELRGALIDGARRQHAPERELIRCRPSRSADRCRCGSDFRCMPRSTSRTSRSAASARRVTRRAPRDDATRATRSASRWLLRPPRHHDAPRAAAGACRRDWCGCRNNVDAGSALTRAAANATRELSGAHTGKLSAPGARVTRRPFGTREFAYPDVRFVARLEIAIRNVRDELAIG